MKTKANPVRANWKLTSSTTVRAGTIIMTTIVIRYTATAIYLPVSEGELSTQLQIERNTQSFDFAVNPDFPFFHLSTLFNGLLFADPFHSSEAILD